MKGRTLRYVMAAGSLALIAGCGHASAEHAAKAAADSARAEGASPVEVSRRAEHARQSVQARETARKAIKNHNLALAEGSSLRLAAVTDISSQKNKAGDAFVARTTSAALTEAGDT